MKLIGPKEHQSWMQFGEKKKKKTIVSYDGYDEEKKQIPFVK